MLDSDVSCHRYTMLKKGEKLSGKRVYFTGPLREKIHVVKRKERIRKYSGSSMIEASLGLNKILS